MDDARRLLSRGLAELAVPAGGKQIDQVLSWLDMLEQWNRIYNLTRIPPAQRLARVVLMSIAALPHLKPGRVLDVGSGAGIPGIPLAIFAPQNDYTLVESSNKKSRFIEQSRLELGLENLRSCCTRIESMPPDTYNTIIARAYAQADVLLKTSRHLSGVHTRWLMFKGKSVFAEAEKISTDEIQSRIHQVAVPGLDEPLMLLSMWSR